MERSRVSFGATEIAYRVERSARRRTVAVTVAADQGVVLMAPSAAPLERLDRVVRDKAAWIVERLRHVAQVDEAPRPREFVSGEN